MFKHSKVAAIAVATLGMLFGTIVPANADPVTNLTYAQFTGTDGYKELQAASAASAQYISTQSGIDVESTTSMSIQGTNISVTSKIEATKTAVRVSVNSDGTSVSYLVIGTKAYLPVEAYLDTLDGPYTTDDVVSHIPNAANKIVQMNKVPDLLSDSTPDKIFSPTQDSAFSRTIEQYSALLSMFTFSEVTKIVSGDDPTFMDYNFDMALSAGGSTAVVHETATFKSGLMTGIRITTSSEGVQVTETDIIYTIKNDLVIDAPEANILITETSVKKAITQATVDSKLHTQANAIVNKAGALAKKAKTDRSPKQLMAAADSLKIKYAKIANGIKISVTISKVKANLCITAIKKTTNIKNC